LAENVYTCDECGKTVRSTRTRAFYDEDGRMMGIADEYTHECSEGQTMHPFALRPFADSRDDLWRLLNEKLDLRPADDGPGSG